MKPLILCLALWVFPGAGFARQAPVAPVALITQFQHEPSVAVREALQSELDDIMRPSGLHFVWRPIGEENASAVEIVVVTFKGRCDVESMQPSAILPSALGWTHVSNGEILPFSDVDCDAVRGFIQEELATRAESQREADFGRALGRVLAHELYHVLAHTSGHGDCGVGKSGFTVRDLLARVFTFHPAEVRKLVSSKAYQVLERAAALAAPGTTP